MIRFDSMLEPGKYFKVDFGYPCKDFKNQPIVQSAIDTY